MRVAIFARLVSRLRRHCGINVMRVMQRDLGQAARIPSRCPGLSCRVLPLEETLALCADPELELSEEWVRDAYRRESVCLGAFSGGRLVGYSWLAYAPTRYTAGVWVDVGAACRYSYKTFVRPAQRGQRIAQALHALADDPALWRGRTRALSIVDLDNASSLAALEHAGSRAAGYAAYWKIAGKVLAFRSPGAKRSGVRFYGSLRPRLMPFLRRRLGLNLCRVVVLDLPDQPEPQVLKSTLEYRVMSEAALMPWCAAALELNEKTLRAAFARGDSCVGAFDGDRLVGYMFFAFRSTPDSGGIWVDFHERGRYAYKSYLLPEYRGRRIGREIYGFAPRACPGADRSYTIGIVHLDNTTSQRSAEGMGWRTVGFVGYLNLFGKLLAFQSPGARRYGLRFFKPRAAPVLQEARAT